MEGLGEASSLMDDSLASRMVDKRRNTNENLQRSIHLLEEAVGSQRKDSQRRLKSRHTLTPQSRNQSQQNTPQRLHDRTQSSAFANTSMGALGTTFNETLATSFTTKIEPPEFTSNITMLLNDDPGISASTGVFEEFKDCLHRYSSDQHIFDLLSNYQLICQEQVAVLRGLVKSAAPHQQKFNQTVNTLNILEQEAQTWTLIHSLFKDRFEGEVDDSQTDSLMDLDSLEKYRSDRDLVESLYKTDRSITQAQLVVDWLEHGNRDTSDKFDENLVYFMDKAVAWENTLHKLERKKTTMSAYGRKLVDEMDPDAPFRQSGHLDDLDKEDETRLLKYLFVCVRAGQLDKAQEMCIQCGQPWRAATFDGWQLRHDPNYNHLSGEGMLGPIEGNHLRDVWKEVCWRMAQDPKVSLFEKAIYGARSGNLASMLCVCDSWKDYLWAYYRVLIDQRIETHLRENYQGARPLQDLPSEYWATSVQPEQIFREIEASDNQTVKREAAEWYAVVQKHIILMDLDGLIEVMYSWIQAYEAQIPRHLLRFTVHLILFLRRIGHTSKDELCHAVMEAYVRFLIADDHVDLVATYVRSLPGHAQVVWYAKFLQGIEDGAKRQHCLHLAEQSQLDIHSITKMVVENVRSEGNEDVMSAREPGLDQAISEDDQRKISAVDWLVFDPTQRAEALSQANAIMRAFIALRKTTACRAVMEKIPQDSIPIIQRNWKIQSGSDELPPTIDSSVREYLAITAYLDAMEEFNVWFEFFHHHKPPPPNQPSSASFTDQVAFEHRQKQFGIEMERWQHTLEQHTKNSKERMYNVLLFPQGWMTNVHEMIGGDEGRLVQMSRLRQLCLPQICILLHTVLHSTQNYRESLQLADVIASEDRRLYAEFQKEELHKLLDLLRESSLSLLADNPDPLGYIAS